MTLTWAYTLKKTGKVNTVDKELAYVKQTDGEVEICSEKKKKKKKATYRTLRVWL